MEELGKVHQLIIPLFGHKMTFNLEVIFMSWIVMVVLIVFGYYTTRKTNIKPNLFQVVGELELFLLESLGPERGVPLFQGLLLTRILG